MNSKNNNPTPASWLETLMLLVVPVVFFLVLCLLIYLIYTGRL